MEASSNNQASIIVAPPQIAVDESDQDYDRGPNQANIITDPPLQIAEDESDQDYDRGPSQANIITDPHLQIAADESDQDYDRGSNQASIITDPPLQIAVDESDQDYDRGPRDDPEEDEDEETSSGDEDGDDEAYSSGRNSPQLSTKSLTESVLDYHWENGRRYYGEGPGAYFMPNDDAEQARLSIMHQIYTTLFEEGLTKAPIADDVEHILDIGTGPGEWAIAMAEKYPNAQVIGTDLSAIQIIMDVPNNVLFQLDDAEEEWTWPKNHFDLIHFRNMSGSFISWTDIYKQAFEHLKPGGYIEVIDTQLAHWISEMPDSPPADFVRALKSASDKSGRPVGVAHIKRPILRRCGFTEIQVGMTALPLGTWPPDERQRRLGTMWLIGVLEGIEAVSLRLLTGQKGWTAEQVRELCDRVKEHLTSGNIESYTPVHYCVARKPFNPPNA